MKTTIIGSAGKTVRSDIKVTVTDLDSGPAQVSLVSSVESMYGDAIRRQIDSVLEEFGSPSLRIDAEDSGALPFVIQARLEAALAQHLSVPLSTINSVASQGSDKNRLRRSRLYVPGGTPKLLPSIGLFGADSIILDLEDSVATSEKFAALALIRRALLSVDFGASEKLVRVNSGSQGLQEIAVLCPAGVEGFVLPKVESPSDILDAAKVLESQGSQAVLLPIIETAKGLHFSYEIASCHPRVAAIALGVEDYLADIGAERTETGGALEWAILKLVNSCRAAGVSPLGPIFGQVDDEEGMKNYAARVAALGCDGVGCLHPRQVAPAHAGLSPSPETLDKARRIVAAFDEAVSRGEGVLSLDGKMIDAPVAAQARLTLKRAGVTS
jgi:citrate lyase subunit beta / citryl-CoA lyase